VVVGSVAKSSLSSAIFQYLKRVNTHGIPADVGLQNLMPLFEMSLF
jgi:hypothetical protein